MKKPKLKLLAHERLLMKELSKRLPIDAFIYLSFSRYLFWSEAHIALGMKPEPEQTLRLRVTLASDRERSFTWEGLALKDGVYAIDQWLLQRRALTATPVKALPAAPLALPEVAA